MIIAIVVLILLLVLWGIVIFNRFVRERNLVREAWSGIDVQLKRRYNLIPNLVETVKGYSRHEHKLFGDVARLRSRYTDTGVVRERGEAESTLSRMIKTLFAVAEAYPDLKANKNFLDLQKNLSEIENQIQLARRYYNGTVRNYDISIESFPSMIIARLCGFRRVDFFEIEYATERKSPDVKFH